MASTHTTKITAKSEADYDAEYATKITVSGQDSGDVITIAPADSDVTLTIDKATAKMKLTNQDQVIWKEAESLKYDGTETVSSPDPFYISTEGYGAMRNTFQPGSYDFSATAKMEHDENRFDAYYFVGDMKEVLGDYIELTGNPMFMPKYGFYQGNADCYNGEGEELLVDGINRAKEYQEHDMPVGWFLPNDGYGCGYGKSTDADENIDNLGKFVQEARNYGFVSGL